MIQQGRGDLTPQFAAAAALAAEYDQPAYVLVPEGERRAMAVFWPEIQPWDRRRIVAIILPNGAVFEWSPANTE
jgi:hypothetical protein